MKRNPTALALGHGLLGFMLRIKVGLLGDEVMECDGVAGFDVARIWVVGFATAIAFPGHGKFYAALVKGE